MGLHYSALPSFVLFLFRRYSAKLEDSETLGIKNAEKDSFAPAPGEADFFLA